MSELLAVHGVGVVTDGYSDVRALVEGLGDALTVTPHAEHAFDTDVVARPLGGAEDCDAMKVPSPCQKHGTRPLPEYGTLDAAAVGQHDALAQLGLRAGHQAWTMAGLGAVEGERIGLLFVSSWGTADSTVAYLESMLEEGGRYASPRHFSRSVYSSVASIMAIHFKIQGPCETLAFATDPVRGALWQARRLLLRGRAERVMVVWAEQASEIAQDLARRAVRELGRKAYARYEEKLGFGAVAVVVGKGETGGICLVDPEEVGEAEVRNLPFAMDGALRFVASLLEEE